MAPKRRFGDASMKGEIPKGYEKLLTIEDDAVKQHRKHVCKRLHCRKYCA